MMNNRGQVYPFVALMLVAMLGVSALSVDVGYYRYQQRIQQSAADSAAIAGAQASTFASPNAENAAFQDAALNGFATPNNSGITVAVDPNYSDSYTTGGTAVKVTITKAYPRFFGSIFMGGNQSLSTVAVARETAGGSADYDCMLALGAPGFSTAGGSINAPNCGIMSNGGLSAAGGTFDAKSIGYAGTESVAGTSFTGATPAPAAAVSDPCTTLYTGCKYLANNPQPQTGCTNISRAGASVSLSPGCYSGISLAGGSLDFAPGVYVLTGPISVAGVTAITCNSCTGGSSGVTLVDANGSAISMSGSTVTLPAPTTGDFAGMLLYDPTGTSVSIAGGAGSVTGVVYAPKASLSVAGSLIDGFAALIGNGFSLAGTGIATFATPPPNSDIFLSGSTSLAE
jgi:Putative Flp pilus-assembly TadE/G-like